MAGGTCARNTADLAFAKQAGTSLAGSLCTAERATTSGMRRTGQTAEMLTDAICCMRRLRASQAGRPRTPRPTPPTPSRPASRSRRAMRHPRRRPRSQLRTPTPAWAKTRGTQRGWRPASSRTRSPAAPAPRACSRSTSPATARFRGACLVPSRSSGRLLSPPWIHTLFETPHWDRHGAGATFFASRLRRRWRKRDGSRPALPSTAPPRGARHGLFILFYTRGCECGGKAMT